MSETSSINSTCPFVPNDFIGKSEKIQNLGSGSFGNVALYNTPLGRRVVKETKTEDKSLGYPPDFLTEVDMLFKLRSVKTVVTILGVCFDNDKKKGYILLEPLDINLSEWIKRNSFEQRIAQIPNIITMVGGAIAMMHHFSFIHNDVKPNNILVKRDNDTKDYIFKLADFGHATHVTDSNSHYCGIKQYRAPVATNIYKSEFWAFMVTLIEVIIGNRLMTKDDDVLNFYKPYLSRTDTNRMKFDLSTYLKSIITREQFEKIPSNFWTFVDPLINGQDIRINECLSKIGIILNINVINEVNKSISRSVDIHPRFNIIEDEYKNRLKLVQLSKYFDKFSRLYNKFLRLILEEQNLSDIDLKYYAEVAFIIIARGKAIKFEYFNNQDKFLLFQRAFLMKVGYQIVLL